MGHLMNLIRALTIPSIYFMSGLPSVSFSPILCAKYGPHTWSSKGLMVSIITGIVATTLQTLILRYQPLRRWLDIPSVPSRYEGRLPSFKESIDYVIKSFKETQAEANRQARRR